jgi:anti-sigma factor RsiW
MSCSQDRLKDLLLGELGPGERREAEQHIAQCGACAEEWDRLQITRGALASLREEEPPRRIAFVSDKVFEPKWWQVWGGFRWAGVAALLALAASIVAHGYISRPPAATIVQSAPVAPAAAPVNVQAEVDRVVQLRLAEAEARRTAETAKLVQDMEKRFAEGRRMDLVAFEEQIRVLRNQQSRFVVASNDFAKERP